MNPALPPIQEIVEIYTELRKRGLSATDVLEKLRVRIASLSREDQAEIVRQVRVAEAEIKQLLINNAKAQNTPKQSPADPKVVTYVNGAPGMPSVGMQTCPRCNKLSPITEVLCGYCGTFLQGGKAQFETTRLEDPNKFDSIYFGEDSTLILMLKDSNYAYRLRPQENRHDVVIGRSNGASMKPDIDLQEHSADSLGVSRLHMSVRYEPKDHSICMIDMNSANGTYLNGQKLHPREVRVIRHGDEVRLGKLALRVYFQHGGTKQ